jgi:hypothetical protein
VDVRSAGWLDIHVSRDVEAMAPTSHPTMRAPLMVRARPRAQAQYLARLLAMVGIMVPPERVVAAAGVEPAGWVRPDAPELPRGRPGAAERAPRAREDALAEQVHAQTLICP